MTSMQSGIGRSSYGVSAGANQGGSSKSSIGADAVVIIVGFVLLVVFVLATLLTFLWLHYKWSDRVKGKKPTEAERILEAWHKNPTDMDGNPMSHETYLKVVKTYEELRAACQVVQGSPGSSRHSNIGRNENI